MRFHAWRRVRSRIGANDGAAAGKTEGAGLMPDSSAANDDVAARTNTRATPARRSVREGLLLALVVAMTFAVGYAARHVPFTPASPLGYWIGVAGGVAMLLLFLYPLRKRWRIAARWGRTRWWFALHMVLGVAGPLLVVLHSTLRLRSVNATIAFACMGLVATSGIVGRYFYGRIHHGLYGQRASLAEFRAEAGLGSAEMRSKLAFAPAVETRLERFAAHAEKVGRDGLKRPWRFFILGFAGWFEGWRSGREVVRQLEDRARAEGWSQAALSRRTRAARALVARYLRAVQRVAQFTVFERLFSWWHVLHVPLVYMLVLSAIAHVIAVHMY
jgi:hypothetical protein